MYFYYCFSNKRGFDQVCNDEQLYAKPWSLIQSNGSYYLVLWEQISWQSLYEHKDYFFPLQSVVDVCQIMNNQTMALLHWMIYQYCCSYRSVVNLFISDPEIYLKQKDKFKTVKKKDLYMHRDISIEGQKLIAYPDIMSLRSRESNRELCLFANDSQARVMKYYYELQQWYKNILITTSANICMDYGDLREIICYFPDTPYYKYQQDPRIFIPEVLEKMAEIYGATLHYMKA